MARDNVSVDDKAMQLEATRYWVPHLRGTEPAGRSEHRFGGPRGRAAKRAPAAVNRGNTLGAPKKTKLPATSVSARSGHAIDRRIDRISWGHTHLGPTLRVTGS